MKLLRLAAALCLLVVCGLAPELASATNYTLWINGRNGGGIVGDYNSFAYWGPASMPAGVNKKAVNWDGYNSISSQSYHIRDALDCFCTGSNWCYIATHSPGDLMMGYTLANYGGSARMKKNASPNSSGVCGNSDGSSQTGWNIKWVRAASCAAGGSVVGDYGSWAVSDPLTQDLKTSTARAMYNHNTTCGIWFYMYAGAKGTAYSGTLPGQDDEAAAYHSSGGVSGSSGGPPADPARRRRLLAEGKHRPRPRPDAAPRREGVYQQKPFAEGIFGRRMAERGKDALPDRVRQGRESGKQ